ncbi:MAG: HD domain-containing protein [Chloroflexi bacterium]|nr:HD domain-containing protein [Chloroflexota bacterium]
MADSRRVPFRLYIFTFVIAAMALLALVIEAGMHYQFAGSLQSYVIVALSLIAFIAVGGIFPLRLTPRVKVSIVTAPMFAAVLVLPPAPAALVILAGTLAYHGYLHARHRRTWFDAVFNVSRATLQGAVGATVYRALSPYSLIASFSSHSSWSGWRIGLLAIGLSASVYYLINIVTVFGAAGLALHQNPFKLWSANLRMEISQQLFLFIFGVLTAAIALILPELTILMLFPVLAVHLAWQSALQLQTHSREALETIADALDVRTYGEYGHSHRVSDLAVAIAEELGAGGQDLEVIRLAGRLHDIGKIGFSDALLKHTAFTIDPIDMEFRRHPEIGWQLLGRMRQYQSIRDYIHYQAERPDGSGFPSGLQRQHIPLGAAVIRVAEAFDLLRSQVDAEPAVQDEFALQQLQSKAGTLWDSSSIAALSTVIQRRTATSSAPREGRHPLDA